MAIIGEVALSPDDRRSLSFADDFEERFIRQASADRSIAETLDMAWDMLSPYADEELKRIHAETIAAHAPATEWARHEGDDVALGVVGRF